MQDVTLLDAIEASSTTARKVTLGWQYGGDLNAAVAGAGLRHAALLVSEAAVLCRMTRGIGVGVLVRTAYEYSVVGSFVLHGGRDALLAVDLDRLEAELRLGQIHRIDDDKLAMLERQITATKSHFEGRKRPSTTLRDMADRVSRLVEADEGGPVNAYDTLYRAHSMMDVHPPKVLKQMVDLTQPGFSVRDLGPWGDHIGQTGVVTMYVNLLGKWIALRLGTSPAVWQMHLRKLTASIDARHQDRIIAAMEEEFMWNDDQ